MESPFERSELLLGKEALLKLQGARVAVFGLGGVGGYVVEALARSGVGHLDLIDNDTVSITNINRQIIATRDTVGERKTAVCKARALSINPDLEIRTYDMFYLPETASQFPFSEYSYVVDAIDTITGKLSIIEECTKLGIPVISCMGAGNKLDPTAFRVADISKTSVCPLAKVIRRELKKRGIMHCKVVYSTEPAIAPKQEIAVPEGSSRRQTPGSVAFVPSVAGLILAGEVIKDLAL